MYRRTPWTAAACVLLATAGSLNDAAANEPIRPTAFVAAAGTAGPQTLAGGGAVARAGVERGSLGGFVEIGIAWHVSGPETQGGSEYHATVAAELTAGEPDAPRVSVYGGGTLMHLERRWTEHQIPFDTTFTAPVLGFSAGHGPVRVDLQLKLPLGLVKVNDEARLDLSPQVQLAVGYAWR